jgi:hypothetical protein
MTTVSPYGLEIFESRTSSIDADGPACRHVQKVTPLVVGPPVVSVWVAMAILGTAMAGTADGTVGR